MEKVYPKLKSFCQERGYDFQMVDMRWGIREEATDDHTMTELCMTELTTCQRLSTGPNFVVSVSMPIATVWSPKGQLSKPYRFSCWSAQ